jgi:hypothetical protein
MKLVFKSFPQKKPLPSSLQKEKIPDFKMQLYDYIRYFTFLIPGNFTITFYYRIEKESKIIQSQHISRIKNETRSKNQPEPRDAVPPSAARQRRRNKVKSGSTGQTKIDIKHYRPGYTWNRGGRMKEIRIRYFSLYI